MGFTTRHRITRWGLPIAGLVLLLMFTSGLFAGQGRAVPVTQSGSFASTASISVQSFQPSGSGPTHGTARIVINGRAPGSITWSPPGLKNFKPEDCSGVIHTGDRLVECYFERGTVVTLAATPDAGYKFYRWDGACRDAGPTCQVTIDHTSSVAARFISADDVPGPGPKVTTRKCKQAKKGVKRAKARLNKARKSTKNRAKAKQKKARKALKRAQAKVKKAC